MSDVVKQALEERGERYGLFLPLAGIAQQLKTVIYVELNNRDKALAPDQTEAIDMIFHKIARIVNGDSNYVDNWVDIAGYAQLVADRLR